MCLMLCCAGTVMSCCMEHDTDLHSEIWMTEEKRWQENPKWVKWSVLQNGVYGFPGDEEMNFAAERMPLYNKSMPWLNVTAQIIRKSPQFKTVTFLEIFIYFSCIYAVNVLYMHLVCI